jgi:hypothetical protein
MDKKKEQYWQEHITGWRASGLSQADYCRRHGISKSTFWLWKRKLTAPKSKTAAPVIVPVSLERIIKTPLPKPICLYVSEFRLEIEAGFCKHTLRELLSVIGSQC